MKRIICLLIALMLVSCATQRPPAPPEPPKVYFPPTEETPPEGSLFSGSRAFFFEDHRARRIGDVITVKILESYQSSMDVNNKMSRSTEVSAGVNSLLGFEKALEQSNPNFSSSSMFGGEYSSTVNGQGKLSRNTKIVATITARVIDVLPNGNLVIQGVRVIRQNENLEYLTVTGIVRPEDIDADNSVLSTQIADAHIEYSGAGPNASVTRGPGWLSRILQIIWLF